MNPLQLSPVRLGQSDLHVTPICLGTMTFGEQVNEATAHAILDRSVALGVNFIDTAEMYSVPTRAETYGATETIMGHWMAQNPGMRQRIVLATKVAGPSRGMPWVREGKGIMLDQFANPDNPLAHFKTTGPELWEQTGGQITHFVSAMGTTGTIMGVGRFLKLKNPDIKIVGAQPAEGSQIPGIRKWPEAYLPAIYDPSVVDQFELIEQKDAEAMARRLAAEEGICAGVSAAGALVAALRVAQQARNATIVFIVCDRGDRYLSTGLFDEQA